MFMLPNSIFEHYKVFASPKEIKYYTELNLTGDRLFVIYNTNNDTTRIYLISKNGTVNKSARWCGIQPCTFYGPDLFGMVDGTYIRYNPGRDTLETTTLYESPSEEIRYKLDLCKGIIKRGIIK